MFKKLRNKLLLVNMIIISALLLGSFAVIYVITYQNIRTSTTENLHQIIDFDRRMHMPMLPGSTAPVRSIPRGNNTDRRADMMAQFVVHANANGTIEDIRSPFEMDLDSGDFDVAKIISDPDNRGVISYLGGYWAYLTQPDHSGYKIGFVDYTSERQILLKLPLILLAVWAAALAAAFFISLSSANKSINPVEESYNKQKQFVADASHELKTPLTTINTNIDVLLGHPESTIGAEKKWLEYIRSETERMAKLTTDLLYLARLDHTENKPLKYVSSFSEIAENVILTMEAVAFEKSINFNYSIEPSISVYAPEEQLKQIMMILLDNAVKYTPEGGGIDISLAREKNDAVMKVRNSGNGISEEDMKHIFDRFYRADKSRARESGGYGLGLAIAKSICESCGGNIAVASETGKYVEFSVRLKIA